jgi:hypothetical protein
LLISAANHPGRAQILKIGERMRLGFSLFPATLAASFALLALPSSTFAQEPNVGPAMASAAALPEAPRPQFEASAADSSAQQASQTQAPAQGSSSTQTTAQQSDAEKSQHQKAEEQIKEQEQQRVVGILPSFNVSYRSDAVSLTAAQKLKLAFRSAVDPVAFATPFLVAGYHEAMDDDKGFGWGIEGYGKRSGAAYLDAFDGTMIGNGILPAILHQDPRYFRLGHGSTTHRLLYAMATTVMCKHDNTGKWEPNYSNVSGNIISGAISNLYYPSQNSGIGQTFSNGIIVTGEGTIGGVFQEFWPDISRKILHKDPTRGLDAQARAADQAAKQAKKDSLQNQK